MMQLFNRRVLVRACFCAERAGRRYNSGAHFCACCLQLFRTNVAADTIGNRYWFTAHSLNFWPSWNFFCRRLSDSEHIWAGEHFSCSVEVDNQHAGFSRPTPRRVRRAHGVVLLPFAAAVRNASTSSLKPLAPAVQHTSAYTHHCNPNRAFFFSPLYP